MLIYVTIVPSRTKTITNELCKYFFYCSDIVLLLCVHEIIKCRKGNIGYDGITDK
jgi:hypothetical protein